MTILISQHFFLTDATMKVHKNQLVVDVKKVPLFVIKEIFLMSLESNDKIKYTQLNFLGVCLLSVKMSLKKFNKMFFYRKLSLDYDFCVDGCLSVDKLTGLVFLFVAAKKYVDMSELFGLLEGSFYLKLVYIDELIKRDMICVTDPATHTNISSICHILLTSNKSEYYLMKDTLSPLKCTLSPDLFINLNASRKELKMLNPKSTNLTVSQTKPNHNQNKHKLEDLTKIINKSRDPIPLADEI